MLFFPYFCLIQQLEPLRKQQALLGFRLLLDTHQTSQAHMQTKVQPELMQSGQFRGAFFGYQI